MASSSTPTPPAAMDGRIAEPLALQRLKLDADNPRFGGTQAGLTDQTAVLDHIVSGYGIDDVLSSLAVNGYFKAEPLVGRQSGDDVVIVEGNRRLAACLVLAGDERARNQASKAAPYRDLWIKHGRKTIDPIPVIIFDTSDNDAELLSYLGVRHISASAPWDSYAKAHWAAQVVSTTNLTVTDISIMIGDPHRTVARLLEGYYVVRQAVREGYFTPSDCVRRGRGSVTEYPFSWVYTILGYSAARKFLVLDDDGPRPDPLPTESLPRIRFLFVAMFGSQSLGRNAVIKDSRALGNLASALLDRDKVALLEQGVLLDEAIRLTRPLDERVVENLLEVRRLQGEVTSTLAQQPISSEVATEHLPLVQGNRRAAGAIEKSFRDVLFPDETE
jgi:hypothetical protein